MNIILSSHFYALYHKVKKVQYPTIIFLQKTPVRPLLTFPTRTVSKICINSHKYLLTCGAESAKLWSISQQRNDENQYISSSVCPENCRLVQGSPDRDVEFLSERLR